MSKKKSSKKRKKIKGKKGSSSALAISNSNLDIVDVKPETGLVGSEDPISYFSSYEQRYNLEIPEIPVRSPRLAKQLIEMEEHSYIVRSTLRQAGRDALSSNDGSDRGFSMSPFLADGETPCPPEVLAIGTDLFSRRNYDYTLIGADRTEKGLKKALAAGNSYMELGIEKEGIGRNDYGIAQTQYLPTWQIFKIRTPQGQTLGFEQRKSLTDENPISIPTWRMMEFTHDLDVLYGRSLWNPRESRESWTLVKEASHQAAITSREMAHNPNIHKMPPGTSDKQKEVYKNSHEQHKKGGMVTDYYIYHEQDIKKLTTGGGQSMTPALENLTYRRIELIPPGVPLFYYPEFSRFLKGARDLSNQPAQNYARLRHSWCKIIAKAVRQALDVELVLRLGYERYMELLREYKGTMYIIQFPTWTVNEFSSQSNDENKPYDDLKQDGDGGNNDNDDNNDDLEDNANSNGNRNGHVAILER